MKIDNQFSVTNIDVSKFPYPKVYVKGWFTIIGDTSEYDGSINIETNREECGLNIVLEKVRTQKGDDREDIKHDLQEQADEWNENLKENWDAELKRCFEYLANYERKQLAEIDKHKSNLEKYETSLKTLTPQSLNHLTN
jgi:uncharacterized protein YpuA (DUF1002 family)